MQLRLLQLEKDFQGDIYINESMCLLYATDASAYREIPLAVTRPKDSNDIQILIEFARKNKTSLIPRTAGTSLAGQVVGGGIIVDVSKYMTEMIEFNPEEHWVRVQPGVVLDELNLFVRKEGLFFGPETSTSNRCMIGGMVGNNSCGAHSILYGSTRDHTLSVKAILSDGSEAEFGVLTKKEYLEKLSLKGLEGEIYRNIDQVLSDPGNQQEIRKEFPDPSIHRRNTGYAIDLLLESEVFSDTKEAFNFSKLLAGSEGTLAFITEIKLNLVPLPPKEKALIAVHCNSLEEAFKGNLLALKYNPGSVELMDDVVLECTKGNIEQRKNRFFVKGDPKALLIVEFARDTKKEIEELASAMESEMREAGYGYHFPLLYGPEIPKVWNLRKAGLGLLSNVPGDAKPVAVVEDTAVLPEVLPTYMKDFQAMLEKYGKSCVYYAHIATGELHLRPVLDLKKQADVDLYYQIALDTAKLVKKYNGSLSGEHGDGRLRAEFISLMIGQKNYQLLRDIKATWDPEKIFNPGKIVDAISMKSNLRYSPDQHTRQFETVFDFSESTGIMRAAEKCNGSGDCLKSELIGGSMCPSYMATRDEQNSTRARANILREFLTNSTKKNPFDQEEIYEVMDLCLSCKACKSECPSSVDVAKLKAEFLQHYYDSNGIPLRTKAISYINSINKLASAFPGISNFFMKNGITSSLIKRILGFASNRSLPLLHKTTLTRYYQNLSKDTGKIRKVYLFNDEFTNYNDTDVGIKAIRLLNNLGYEVCIPRHSESGRTFLSKGLLRKAKQKAIQNVLLLKDIISEKSPLLGIEPSAILAFRDEYPDLVGDYLKEDAKNLAMNVFQVDEFLAEEMDKGRISKEQFTSDKKHIKLHGHCQQKAIASTDPTLRILSFPENYSVEEIPSGCCGMAGSFGYEKEHYELSMKVGELVLFPAVRKTEEQIILAAPGTSCRHQIKDGTGRQVFHPVEILNNALIS
ncbi:MAG: FAD-binding protein [Bacteroidetes bacterium]|nr:FAD-binding protein [Bacteroidota bacterium]